MSFSSRLLDPFVSADESRIAEGTLGARRLISAKGLEARLLEALGNGNWLSEPERRNDGVDGAVLSEVPVNDEDEVTEPSSGREKQQEGTSQSVASTIHVLVAHDLPVSREKRLL